MEPIKEEGVFKVSFKGTELDASQHMSLSFFYHSEILREFNEFPSFMLAYNELTRKKQANSFSNIVNVVTFGDVKIPDIQAYFVILRTVPAQTGQGDNEAEREGYLVIRKKDGQNLIAGYWPFSFFSHHMDMSLNPDIDLQRMAKSPEKFENLLLIT